MPLYTVLYSPEAIASALALAELAEAVRSDAAAVDVDDGSFAADLPEPTPATFEVYGELEAGTPDDAIASVAGVLAAKLPVDVDVRAEVPMLAFASRYSREAVALIESTRVARASLVVKDPA